MHPNTRESILLAAIGFKYKDNKEVISLEFILPASISSTSPFPIVSFISIPSSMVLVVSSNKALFNVPLVAKTPIVLVLVIKAAGFIAGSIPIKGMSYVFLKKVIAFVVAVLQATTISLQFFLSKNSVFFLHCLQQR